MTSQLKTLVLLVLLSALILAIGFFAGGQNGLIIAFGFALLMNVASFWFSDKIALKTYKAKEVSELDSPLLHKLITELAHNANIPKPKIYIVPGKVPNAFATGRNPEHAAVAVTEGILEILSTEELRGVLAHEISHIAHRDILIQGVAAVLGTTIMFLANMARFGAILGSDNRRSNPALLIIVSILAPIAATLIQMAISRSREYLADDGGAKYSGNPKALASALAKLQSSNQLSPMPNSTEATAHMLIISPLLGGSLKNLFSTHPPTEERIRRLMSKMN